MDNQTANQTAPQPTPQPTQETTRQPEIPQDIRAFLENILEDAGMTLTPELKEPMLFDLYTRLEKKLIADAMENMKPEDVEAFTQVIQTSTNKEEIEQFINAHLPNAKEVFVQSLVDFRTYFLAGTQQTAPQTEAPQPADNQPAGS